MMSMSCLVNHNNKKKQTTKQIKNTDCKPLVSWPWPNFQPNVILLLHRKLSCLLTNTSVGLILMAVLILWLKWYYKDLFYI